MPNAETFFKDPLRFFIGLIGEPGSGKTKQAIGFPKCYFISIGDSYGLKTVLEDPANAKYRNNLVWHEAMDLEHQKEARDLFKVTDKPEDRGSIYGCLAHAKQLASDKVIETLVLDGGSFLADFKGAEIGKTSGTTEGDRWAYYRQLKSDLTWFVNANVMPLVSRYQLNVILTFHVQRQDEEDKQKQTSKDADMAPRIEGGFRHSLAGLPRAMIYLHQQVKTNGENQTVEFKAYCQKVRVPHVGIIPAKNSYSLPAVVDLTGGKSLYDLLVEKMKQQTKTQVQTQK